MEEKFKRLISVSCAYSDLSYIFSLPCIKSVEKMSRGGFYFTTYFGRRAYNGDVLAEREDGSWTIVDDL